MIRFAFALSMGAFLTLAAAPAMAQQKTAPAASGAATGAAAGQNCKKIYVQKKSARTGNYVHVPRQRCS